MSPSGSQGRDRRQKARVFGRRAEWMAMLALLLRGYRILARNVLAPGGEIDIVALRGRAIAFVEVKARADLDAARTAITPIKRRRLTHAIGWWLSRNRWAVGYDLRGDAIFVGAGKWPVHLVDAYEINLSS